jgi:hypothetical protein
MPGHSHANSKCPCRPARSGSRPIERATPKVKILLAAVAEKLRAVIGGRRAHLRSRLHRAPAGLSLPPALLEAEAAECACPRREAEAAECACFVELLLMRSFVELGINRAIRPRFGVVGSTRPRARPR